MTEQKIAHGEILSLLNRYPRDRRFALAAMQDMQRVYGHVPREGLEALAEHIGCPLSGLYSVATFYRSLSLRPRGKHVIRVCNGTACHIRGSVNLISGISRTLGISPDETTGDGEFSLELVNCLGACALSPVMVIDDAYYGNVTVESLPRIFEAVREEAPR